LKSPLIELRDVSFSYRMYNRPVLNGLSLVLKEGRKVAILGQNGVGKTTLLHIVLGWLRPDNGDVFMNGKPLQSYSQRERGRLMSLVPQKEYIPFEYSMLEYVLLGRAPYLKPLETPGEGDRYIAIESLVRVGLDPSDRRPINRFSGGELQLLKIARALAQKPRIMLLDEPASHLDLHNKRMLIDIMGKQAHAALFTTHDPDVASACADDIVLMREGAILAAGPAQEMLKQRLLSETYDADVSVREIRGKRVTLWF
jgi:iron complex transport system ATP-binding protein